MGPGSQATVDRIAGRWETLEAWSAGPRPSSGVAELFAWSGRVRERARAQGWRPQWEEWISWRDRARRGEVSEDELPADLWARALDLDVAEQRAAEAGYVGARGLERAHVLARHPDESPQADAYRGPVEAFREAAQLGRAGVAMAVPVRPRAWLVVGAVGAVALATVAAWNLRRWRI